MQKIKQDDLWRIVISTKKFEYESGLVEQKSIRKHDLLLL